MSVIWGPECCMVTLSLTSCKSSTQTSQTGRSLAILLDCLSFSPFRRTQPSSMSALPTIHNTRPWWCFRGLTLVGDYAYLFLWLLSSVAIFVRYQRPSISTEADYEPWTTVSRVAPLIIRFLHLELLPYAFTNAAIIRLKSFTDFTVPS
jgi:hypothetical protein